MKAPDSSEKPIDWREQLHHLPRGERSLPAWMRWLIYTPILFITGSGVTLVAGPLLGLSLGSRPEENGGTVWLILGIALTMILAGGISWISHRRGYSRATCRAIFYIFSSPGWILGLFMIWKSAGSR